ncbi:MAG: hypothetical protein CMF62_03915 [Magnetococcales bacterium]|nr:hypothetical protein [Magnetococcales bacterium]|tara:strand:+ start:19225 stop:19707 length:483 start_codon:yes stop_codon:yes gene_type:complete
MGKRKKIELKPFTINTISNRDLVIRMLRREEEITRSEEVQESFKNVLNKPFISLDIEKMVNREVLYEFGFDTSDESVDNYRKIFKYYYKSPHDYDKEVLDSVHYMRNNRCVYYKSKPIKVGDQIPNCKIYKLDGETKTSIYDEISDSDYDKCIIASFSNS